MPPQYVPGYIATITINGTDLHPISGQGTFTQEARAITVTKLGQDSEVNLPGLRAGSLDCDLHLDTQTAVAIQAAVDATAPVAFVWRAGSLGVYDAGQHSGECVITSLAENADPETEWEWSLQARLSGPTAYTPPV